MGQRVTGLYRLTQVPRLYAFLQGLLGGERTRRIIVDEYLRPQPGARVLDIGCGSASLLPIMGQILYTGIDINPLHIAAARDLHGDAGSFHVGTLDTLRDEIEGHFDLVMCIGVLHHLEDAEVQSLASDVNARLAPGGRFVAIDPAFVDGQNPVARWLAARDSGRCVRSPDAYRALLAGSFTIVETEVRHDLLRVPYTHCITMAGSS